MLGADFLICVSPIEYQQLPVFKFEKNVVKMRLLPIIQRSGQLNISYCRIECDIQIFETSFQ